MKDHKGWCLWITGLPGSGKSTITSLLESKLKTLDVSAEVVSVDQVRKHLTPTPTYTEEERSLVYAALVFTSFMLTKNGINVIIDATGNRRRFRKQARRLIKGFMEVYVKCPLDICIHREKTRGQPHLAPPHIYTKAESGIAPNVPGVGVPYERSSPEVTIDSSKLSPSECVNVILKALNTRFLSEN
ncbi:MAG: adenylyl-sulfate kinase [Candidatus Bathyarchaeota archaeon]|nr:MAG: adenylyl-sulfate kinase [Candidatus Bathyarchaeota archaeon]